MDGWVSVIETPGIIVASKGVGVMRGTAMRLQNVSKISKSRCIKKECIGV